MRGEDPPAAELHGNLSPHSGQQGDSVGIEHTRPTAELPTAVRAAAVAGRPVRFLVEDFVFHFPFLGSFMNRIGGVRACQDNARRLLENEQLVVVFPEGVLEQAPRFHVLTTYAPDEADPTGPLVLAADLGPDRERGRGIDAGTTPPDIPVFVAADRPVDQWVKPVPGSSGSFRITGVGRDSFGEDREVEADLVPFYRLHRRIYAVYFDLFTPPEWERKKEEYAAVQERQRRLEQATVAYAQPGEMQPERDFSRSPLFQVMFALCMAGL